MTCPSCRRIWQGAQRCFYCGVLLATTIAPGQMSPQHRPAPDLGIYRYPTSNNINVDSGSMGMIGSPMLAEYWRSQGIIIAGVDEDIEKSG